jgi:hypothetical protein
MVPEFSCKITIEKILADAKRFTEHVVQKIIRIDRGCDTGNVTVSGLFCKMNCPEDMKIVRDNADPASEGSKRRAL